MAQSAILSTRASTRGSISKPSSVKQSIKARNRLFNRSSRNPPLHVVRGFGNSYQLTGGSWIYDASGGAAVAILGKTNQHVQYAINKQMQQGLSYMPSLAFETAATVELANVLISSTGDQLSKAVFYGSGSEASEACLKICRQYHTTEKPNPEPSRTIFIARERSYHGATLGALDISGFDARKALYKDILKNNCSLLKPCYPYRYQGARTDEEYLKGLKNELENEILRLGCQNVAGFIMEPVVGAALGCVAAVPGYLTAMREVCDRYGVLLIFDEIMCGIGRTGYMHAWQREGIAPDIQLIGKGLAAGFAPISGMLVGHKIVDAFEGYAGTGAFNHGHTFQNFPPSAAAALEVLKIIKEDDLLENVRAKGLILEEKLRRRIGNHHHVGDVRGEGLFWGIEFVRDKSSKAPFLRKDSVAESIFHKGLRLHSEAIHVYPGSGTTGVDGDHIIIAPAYTITDDEVDLIVNRVGKLIDEFFATFQPSEQ